ncbi:hypothetical protein BJV78DRAFT_1277781 [Lactifluus subvellereus]|nr:hypothetical protein BJV78DRAFT_1277781 [Lactifluus subvellereus]
MLSWFNRLGPKPSKTPPPRSDRPERPVLQEAAVAPSPLPAENPTLTSEQPRKRAFTAALATPHDAVLAELQGHHPSYDPSPRTDASPSPSAVGPHSLDTLPAATPEVSGSTPSLPPLPDPLYDPFSGATMGILSSTSSPGQSSENFWARLARIRTLQAEVASMHVTMEGIGFGESAMPRLRRTAPRAEGERLEDDEDTDGNGGDEAEMRRAREFERSERRFDGRKERIEQIMAKLDDLSKELAEFHALDTPPVNLAAASHPTTGTSTPVPPTLCHPHLRRISSEASIRGREDLFDSPASLQGPLPTFGGPSGTGAALAQPDAEVP